MAESPEREQRPSQGESEDVDEVERGSKRDKGSMDEEVERAREREEEANEG